MPDPIHPAIVHLPMGLAVIVPLIAGGLALAFWRDWLPRRAWVVVVVLQALLFGAALLSIRTGEGDEERVEHVVPEGALEAHEDAAIVFAWATGIALALSLAAIFVRATTAMRWTVTAAALASVVVLALGVRVGHAGGQLVYAHGAGSAYARSAGAAGVTSAAAADRGETGEAEDEDDD